MQQSFDGIKACEKSQTRTIENREEAQKLKLRQVYEKCLDQSEEVAALTSMRSATNAAGTYKYHHKLLQNTESYIIETRSQPVYGTTMSS